MCINCFCDKKVSISFFRLSRNFSDHLDTFQVIQKFSTLSRNFPGYPETFWTIRKISRLSGNFRGNPEVFRIIWKISMLPGNCPDYPENIQTIQNLSRLSKNFPDNPETFQTIWKLSRRSGSFPVQFQGIRAKTFRSAMPIRRRGFSAPLVLFIQALVISIRTLALPLIATEYDQVFLEPLLAQLCPIFYPRPLERAATTDCSRQDTAVTFFTISDKFSPFSVI